MSTWTLFHPLDVTSTDVLSLGAGSVSRLVSSSLLRQSGDGRTLDFIGSGLRLLDGRLLPTGDIDRVELFDGLDQVLQVLDTGWKLLKILSYYNPLTDRWDMDGLLDYLFQEADRFVGSGGDDCFAGHGGNDRIEGGAGLDTAVYDGLRSGFTLTRGADGWQLTDLRGGEGSDQVDGVERLRFSDLALALDLDGHAGTAARLLGTLFGPEAVARADWAGAALALLDQGVAASRLAELALGSAAFAEQAGSHGNADFVRWVYRNVTGEAPTPAQEAQYVALLDDGRFTQAELALLASQTVQLAERIGLVGLADTGLAYTPMG